MANVFTVQQDGVTVFDQTVEDEALLVTEVVPAELLDNTVVAVPTVVLMNGIAVSVITPTTPV